MVSDIYNNEVLPATHAIKEGLSALGIKWFTENYLKVAFLSTSTTSMMAVLGLSVPQALLVGAGISLTASIILYNLEKRQSLRDNPFAYVLAAEKALN
jgi:Kef-type K+ transport system membrane component KefB